MRPATQQCAFCKVAGHHVRACPTLARITCRRCGQRGHTDRVCKNPPRLPPCWLCQSTEHQADSCPEIPCSRCRQKGHTSSKCQAVLCQYCSRADHTSEKCPLNLLCDRCGCRGHLQTSCTAVACPLCSSFRHTESSCPQARCRRCLNLGHTGQYGCFVQPFCPTCQEERRPYKHHPGTCKFYSCDHCGDKTHLPLDCDSEFLRRR